MLKHISLTSAAERCSTCAFGDFCLPQGLAAADASKMDELVQTRARIAKGQPLFRRGEAVDAIHAIRSGSFKTVLELDDGRRQITGFHLPGELMDLDGVGRADRQTAAVALEDSEVCIIPVAELSALAGQLPSLQQQLMRLMGSEIAHDRQMLLTLGTLRAEERLVAFLLHLSERLAARGYSPTEFVLRMSRAEIGSFLGLTLETVSRQFSGLARAGLLQISQKRVHILDMPRLKRVIGQHCPRGS